MSIPISACITWWNFKMACVKPRTPEKNWNDTPSFMYIKFCQLRINTWFVVPILHIYTSFYIVYFNPPLFPTRQFPGYATESVKSTQDHVHIIGNTENITRIISDYRFKMEITRYKRACRGVQIACLLYSWLI